MHSGHSSHVLLLHLHFIFHGCMWSAHQPSQSPPVFGLPWVVFTGAGRSTDSHLGKLENHTHCLPSGFTNLAYDFAWAISYTARTVLQVCMCQYPTVWWLESPDGNIDDLSRVHGKHVPAHPRHPSQSPNVHLTFHGFLLIAHQDRHFARGFGSSSAVNAG